MSYRRIWAVVSCPCSHCGGTGLEPIALDGATLIATIFNAIGSTQFTTRELRHHASVEGGPLQELLSDRDPKKIGHLLLSIQGKSLGDFRLVRLGTERGRIALWQVVATWPVLPKPAKPLVGRPSRVR